MFFIHYSWTLPLKAQIAIGVALLAALVSTHGASGRAREFSALHHDRCVQQRGPSSIDECATRTIQLASRLHGEEFGYEVAKALH